MTRGPPAVDVRELDGHPALALPGRYDDRLGHAAHVERHGHVGVTCPSHPHGGVHAAAVAVGFGVDQHSVEAGGAPGLQPHRTPDAAGARGDAPVPPETAGGLADCLVRHRVRTRSRPEEQALSIGVAHRAPEGRSEHVLAVAQPVGHVEPVGAVLIGDLGERFPVEQDGRHGVQPVEHELVTLGGRQVGRGQDERCLIGPVDEPDPREQRFVVVQVRIRDETGREQVQVDHAWYRGRDDLVRKCGRNRARSGPHGPPARDLTATNGGARRPGDAHVALAAGGRSSRASRSMVGG